MTATQKRRAQAPNGMRKDAIQTSLFNAYILRGLGMTRLRGRRSGLQERLARRHSGQGLESSGLVQSTGAKGTRVPRLLVSRARSSRYQWAFE